MNRFDAFYQQVVTEGELDAMFDEVENADRALTTDNGLVGVCAGLGVVENPTPDMTVFVETGSAYDPLGQRIRVASDTQVDLTQDSSSVATDVATPGNVKIVSVYLRFSRGASDPRIDGFGAPLNYSLAESFTPIVVQGIESAPPATPPSPLDANDVLLADVTLAFGTTFLVDADIDQSRKAWVYSDVGVGTVPGAVTALSGAIDDVADGTTAITYDGGPNWAGGTSPTNPATTVELQLDKIIGDLADDVATTADGPTRIGFAETQDSFGNVQIEQGTLRSGLEAVINGSGVHRGIRNLLPSDFYGSFIDAGFAIDANGRASSTADGIEAVLSFGQQLSTETNTGQYGIKAITVNVVDDTSSTVTVQLFTVPNNNTTARATVTDGGPSTSNGGGGIQALTLTASGAKFLSGNNENRLILAVSTSGGGSGTRQILGITISWVFEVV